MDAVGKSRTTKIIGYDSQDPVDAVAVRREIGRLRKELSATHRAVAEAEAQMQSERRMAADREATLLQKIDAMEAMLAEAAATKERILLEDAETVRALHEKIYLGHQELYGLNQQIAQLQQQALRDALRRREFETTLAAMRTSRSWRLTRPYRALGSILRRFVSATGIMNVAGIHDRRDVHVV
jgi:chromosome segregation ATPase